MPAADAAIPVVFLHGFAGDTERTWREPGWFDLVREAGRRPVGIDLLGHGAAPKPHDPAAYAELTDRVIAELPVDPHGESSLGFQRQIDICGYSLGARTGLEIAIRHPGLVRRLVLGGVGKNLVAADAYRPMAGDGGLGTDEVGYRFQGLISDAANDPDALAALLACRAGVRDADVFTADALAEVTAQCLIVIGDSDFAGPPEPLAERLADVRTVVLAGVDHFELPKHFGFIDAALEFLDAAPTW